MVTDCLQPLKMNVMILTKQLPYNLKFDQKEKWFGTEYTAIGKYIFIIMQMEIIRYSLHSK